MRPGSTRIDVRRSDEGVLLTMTEVPAQLMLIGLRMFAELLRGETPSGMRRTFGIEPPRTPDEFLEWIFPATYPTSAGASGFRRRHGAAMRAVVLTATRHVLTSWGGNTEQLLRDNDIDNWLIVTGVAQILFARRPRGRPTMSDVAGTTQRLLSFLQASLIIALCPEVDATSRAALESSRS